MACKQSVRKYAGQLDYAWWFLISSSKIERLFESRLAFRFPQTIIWSLNI